jgi:hypothetical protein
MTQDEIIEMAREVGLVVDENRSGFDDLEIFAKLVAAKEREACAKVCEDDINSFKGAYYLANKIRARGDT